MAKLIALVFFTLSVGFSHYALAGQLISAPPDLWKVTVEVGRGYRIVCNSAGDLSDLAIQSRFLYPENKEYTLTLFARRIPFAEAKKIYDSALKTLEEFTFSERISGTLDASDVSVKLEIGERTLEATFYPATDAPASIKQILDFCEHVSSIAWTWSTEMPKKVVIPAARKELDVTKIRSTFKGLTKPLSLKEALERFGRPNGFSSHFGTSKEQCADNPGEDGGTFRFILNDGGEVHLWSPDFSEIHYAARYGPKKGEEEALFLMPGRR